MTVGRGTTYIWTWLTATYLLIYILQTRCFIACSNKNSNLLKHGHEHVRPLTDRELKALKQQNPLLDHWMHGSCGFKAFSGLSVRSLTFVPMLQKVEILVWACNETSGLQYAHQQ